MHTGLTVITGAKDRQHAYVAYVFTLPSRRADPAPGPGPAAELARYDKMSTERSGDPAPASPPAAAGTALGVLSAVLERDGQQLSATQIRQAFSPMRSAEPEPPLTPSATSSL